MNRTRTPLRSAARHTAVKSGMLVLSLLGAAATVTVPQSPQESVDRGTLDGRPVVSLSNDKVSLTLRSVGGAMVRLLMKDDSGKLNPFEGLGHFVCVDGFGPVSKTRKLPGLPGHGEAHRVPWDMASSERRTADSSPSSRRVTAGPRELSPHAAHRRRRERDLRR